MPPSGSSRRRLSSSDTTHLFRHPVPQILKHYGATCQGSHLHSAGDLTNNDLNQPSLRGDAVQAGQPQTPSKPQVMSNPKQHLMNAFHLAGLVNDQGGEYEKYRKQADELKTFSCHVRRFYERQNEILDYFQEIDTLLDSSRRRTRTHQSPQTEYAGERHLAPESDLESVPLLHDPITTGTGGSGPKESAEKLEREDEENASVRWTINVNFLINFLLLAGKIVVACLSNSISLIASLVDSAMDFLSTAIIWWTNRKIDSKSWQSIWQYPAGKRRMEPMGVVVFSVFMISSFVQVLVESIERLFNAPNQPLSIPMTSMVVMWITILVKGIVWLWCRRKKNTSIKALAQDAENDCVLNVFSLLFPYLGQKLNFPLLDAVGGLVLSLYIITEWAGTLFDNVKNLTGRRADPIQHQRVAYLVTRFSPLIQALQHCHVYQAGDDLIVETDVILSPDTPLPVAHDVGESVQYALESLDGISRAYCHVDFSSNPMSGHFQR